MLSRRQLILVGGVLAIIGIVLVITLRRRTGGRKNYAIARNKAISTGPATPIPLTQRLALDHRTFPTKTITFPLNYNDGLFWAKFSVKGVSIAAAVDTGSNYLILAGNRCENCNPSHGKYPDTGVPVGKTSDIHYGSQTDKVYWWHDDVTVDNTGFSLPLEFGVVNEVEGTTHVGNILGLGGSMTHTKKLPVVDQMMFQKKILAPYFHLDFSHGINNSTLVMGAPAQGGGDHNRVSIIDESEAAKELGNELGYNYYLVHLTDIKIDGTSLPKVPKFALIDSGNTNLTCGSQLYKDLTRAMSKGQTLEIELDGKVTLKYPIDYFRRDTIDELPEMLNNKKFHNEVVILGNQFMLGHIWSHDLHKRKLTIM